MFPYSPSVSFEGSKEHPNKLKLIDFSINPIGNSFASSSIVDMMMEPLEHPFPNTRVLIIEDDAEMRSLLRDFFAEEGFEIDSVGNGHDAFGILTQKIFDVVITDIRMPGLTGLDILPRIKKIQPEAAIIVITAFGTEEFRRKAFERGANAYLEKPIHYQELRGLLHDVLLAKEKMAAG
jgi:DNA-binding NtrC family response regulator